MVKKNYDIGNQRLYYQIELTLKVLFGPSDLHATNRPSSDLESQAQTGKSQTDSINERLRASVCWGARSHMLVEGCRGFR